MTSERPCTWLGRDGMHGQALALWTRSARFPIRPARSAKAPYPLSDSIEMGAGPSTSTRL